MKRPFIARQADNQRIIFLDYLRIFAITSVVIGHKFWNPLLLASTDESLSTIVKAAVNLLLLFVSRGGAGVVVFFLVSGYIITYILQTERTTEFLIKRIFRIYPLYIVAVTSQYIALTLDGKAPGLLILSQQLLLVGDLFATPYALNGAEWTLRLEIVFYIFMAILRVFNLINHPKNVLPWIFVAAALVCGYVDPVPTASEAFFGYFTMYFLFFLLGGMFYLYENRQIKIIFLIFFTALIFYEHYSLIATHRAHRIHRVRELFAILAVLIFITAWLYRNRMRATTGVLLLSDMTYALYLFHNWLFPLIRKWLADLHIYFFNPGLQILIVLLLFCFIMVRLIEKPGIRLGRFVLQKWQ